MPNPYCASSSRGAFALSERFSGWSTLAAGLSHAFAATLRNSAAFCVNI
jgi:hypothetical protein